MPRKFLELVTCRCILAFMIGSGFMIHHMLRVNITIAMVPMIASNNSNTTSHGPTFNWNEEQRNTILGCFFWGYIVTQVCGGRLSEMYGTRIVFGVTMLLGSILTVLIPLASSFHYYWVIVARVSLGLLLGPHWPSVIPMTPKWVAPTDTSKFISHTSAASLGVVVMLLISGYLIVNLGWPSLFYITGSLGVVWSMFWFYFAYDSPRQHPRMSNKEKEKLEREVEFDINCISKKTPWKHILTSKPVWAIICLDSCIATTFFLVFNHLPSYLDQVLHVNIEENGILSSFPHLARYIVAAGASYLADKLIKENILSTIAIRKVFCVCPFLGIATLYLIQIFWGYDRVVTSIVFTGFMGLIGMFTAGPIANIVDISPVYSGTILGFNNTAVSVGGILISELVKIFTKNKQTFEQWQYIFSIVLFINLIGTVIYLLFASADTQSWNFEKKEIKQEKLESVTTSLL